MSAFIFAIYPFHFLNLKYLPVPDSLSLSFVFFAFGFFHEERFTLCSLCAGLASIIAPEGILCPISLALYFFIKCKLCAFLQVVLGGLLAIGSVAYASFVIYGDPYAFARRLLTQFSPVPLSSFYVRARTRPLAFVFGTLLSFVLPGSVGTVLLMFISLPHFFYCVLSWVLVVFTTELDFERYGMGMAVFAMIYGCDQYTSFALKFMRIPVLLLGIEVVALAVAVHGLEFYAGPQHYSDLAMVAAPNQFYSL
jgi:hypothetical protein